MFPLVFICTESFRRQYLQMLQLMSTSQYRDRILAEIKLQSVSLAFVTQLCRSEFDCVWERRLSVQFIHSTCSLWCLTDVRINTDPFSGFNYGRLSELFCGILCNTVVHNHVHTDVSSSYRRTVLWLGFVWFLCFYWVQFVCARVSYFVFCVFPLCYCLVVSTSAIDCLERLVSEWPVMCQVGH